MNVGSLTLGPSDWWTNGLVGLIILGLAVWRVTSLLVDEEGPWEIFCRLRQWAGVRYDVRSEAYGTNVVAKAMCCVWCLSVWTGAAFSLAFLINPTVTLFLSLPLALSAICIIIGKAVTHE